MSIELNKESVEQADASSCQGTNCGTTTGDHSSECLAEAAAGQGWELKPGDLCGRDCPIHKILAEQAGGDERGALQELIRVRDWVKNRRGQPEKLKNTGQTYIMIEKCETLDMLEWAIERARAALAQPSPVQSEQAEAERPEVVARVVHSNPVVLGQCGPLNANDELMTVAQHAASVARWAEMFNRVEQERDAALAEVERLRESKGDPVGSLEKCMKVMYERDENAKRLEAALARVAELEKELAMARDAAAKGDAARHAAGGMEMEIHELKTKLAELEKQEPVAWGAFHFGGKRDGKLYTQCETEAQIEAYILDMHRSSDSLTLRKGPLYAAPVAQAQQLNDLDKQCRDDVARALGLRPNQERGFAWSYLLASIKSCVKASGDSAQAQHSVPEGWMRVPIEPLLNMMSDKDHDTRIMAERQLLAMLAAAPGKEGL